jgi:hypothetical protein
MLEAAGWEARAGLGVAVLNDEIYVLGGSKNDDVIVTDADSLDPAPAIFTFGGDRETFDFDDPENYLRIDDEIWKFSLPE